MKRCLAPLAVLALAAPLCLAQQPERKEGRPREEKKYHRELMTQIVKGGAEKAAAELEADAVRNPGDPETDFCLAAAYAKLGDRAKAVAHAKAAVARGLDAGRFAAGPRAIFAPLAEDPEFKAILDAVPPLVHGPLLGAVTPSSAKFWVRTKAAAEVTIRAGDISASARTRPETDFTAVVELAGLSPATRYAYAVEVGGEKIALDPAPAFTTPRAPGAKGKLSIAFGGGAGYTPFFEHMWDTIRAQEVDAFLAMGDNVYIDTPEVPETQRYCYYRRQSRPEWRRFTAGTPVFSIYDDHDFGDNDCHGGPDIELPTWKRPVVQLFRENWANAYYAGGEDPPGCWQHFSLGDIDFIMLDTRYYREKPKKDGSTSMLGPVQVAWLKDRLREAKGTFKVLVSSVPWAMGTKPGSLDTWDGHSAERAEIFDFIAKEKIGGIVLISADRHRSDAWKIERPGAYDLYEFSSSRLTNIHTHPVMKASLFGFNQACSFGRIDFDTAADDPAVTYRIIDIDGHEQGKLELKRSQLGF
ncbi:MAG: alkaline phosphatase D family protein [Verrucomicrobiales bacterium]